MMIGFITVYSFDIGKETIKACSKKEIYEWCFSNWDRIERNFSPSEIPDYIREESFYVGLPSEYGSNGYYFNKDETWEFEPYKKVWIHRKGETEVEEKVEYYNSNLELIA